MKSIKPITFLALVLAFSSCTEMRYASRDRVRVRQEVKEPAKKEGSKEVAKKTEVIPQSGETELAIAEVVAPALPLATPVPVPVADEKGTTQKVNSRSEKIFNKTFRNLVPMKDRISAIPSSVKEKIKKETEKNVVEGRSNGLRLIIIGLIILLIGIILPGAVGYVFYIVGGVIMVVGLILLLLELL